MDGNNDRAWLKALGVVGMPGVVMLLCAGGGAWAGWLAGGKVGAAVGGFIGALIGGAALYRFIGKMLR